jgi:hypothetical protein
VSELKALQQQVSAKVAGITINSTTKAIAGQHSQCESVKTSSGSGQWCVTNKGFLGYVGESNGGYFQLQSYTTSVATSDFKVPSGATITTVP